MILLHVDLGIVQTAAVVTSKVCFLVSVAAVRMYGWHAQVAVELRDSMSLIQLSLQVVCVCDARGSY
jgi:hypothetical protein